MKILSLNTWGGRAGNKELLDFIKSHNDVDVFCFQEIWQGGQDYADVWSGDIDTALFKNIGNVLEDHIGFFRPHWADFFGLALFVKKDLKIKEEGEIFVHRSKDFTKGDFTTNHPRNIQYVTIETPSGLRTICNFHGLWTGGGKDDTEERITQSEKIIKFLEELKNPSILCGDFNLLLESKSLKMFEDFGMKNLIKEFNITSTRSSHYTKPVRFADYTFVSKDIQVNDFKVLPDEVSDHLAMYLDFQ